MHGATRISVALCTRNGAAFIGEQIASILAQTRPVSEIVLSDDDSSDETVAIVESAVAAAASGRRPDLIVLRNAPPLGVTANFQQAALACTGDLVAFSDQDDVWSPRKIERLVAAFVDPDALLAFSDARLVDENGAPLGTTMFDSLRISRRERRLLDTGSAFDALLARNLVTGATMMIRRELLAVAVPFPGSWVHDEWLAAVAAAAGRVVVVEDPLIDYRQHASNAIGAVEPGIRSTLARAFRPLSEQTVRTVPRADALVRVLETVDGAHPGVLDAARGKARFEHGRAGLPRPRWRRIGAVGGALMRGDYRRYGRGAADALRDVLRPL